MQWSPQQDKALVAIKNWLRYGDQPIFKLFGFAGTGKTVLAKEVHDMVEGQVIPMAYTGKAALVMRRKGLTKASTIHSTIYLPSEKAKGQYEKLQAEEKTLQAQLMQSKVHDPAVVKKLEDVRRLMKREVESLNNPSFTLNMESPLRGATLGLLDEMSMVDEIIGADIMSFGTKMLVLGDPGQLDPVRGTGYFMQGEPDIMLTEIHRQARDNPIIHLATTVRENGSLQLGRYGESGVLSASALRDNPQMALDADQIIAGRNATRHACNARYRELKGWSGNLPLQGEKLICLRNNHEVGLLNGLMFNCVKNAEPGEYSRFVDLFVQREDGGDPQCITAWAGYFKGEDMSQMLHSQRREAEEFDYGYTITCHKSQGSQWDNVLLLNESAAFGGSWRKWLYTGITRAAERVQIVQMG